MAQDSKSSLDNKIITHPAHYIEGRVFEPIAVIEEFGLCHHLACVVKYIARAGRKTSALNDLLKASWYLDREIQRSTSGINPCAQALGVSPAFSIQEIVEDWKLSAYLEASLSYILAVRLGSLGKGCCSIKTLRNYASSLKNAMAHLQLAVSTYEQGGSK